MKKFISLLSIIFVFAASSCLNNDGEQENKQSINVKCLNKINSDLGTSLSEANYSVEFDFVANVVNITTFDNKISAATYKIVNIPLSISNDKGYYFSHPAPKVTDMQGNTISSLRITDFYGQFTGYTIKLYYSVNGISTVLAAPVEALYRYSNTTVTSPDSETPFNWSDATYSLSFKLSDADAKAWAADMVVSNIKFADKMPMVITEMELKGLKVTPLVNGYKITADEVIPNMGSVPQEKYTITNLEGTVYPAFYVNDLFLKENFELKFNCIGKEVKVKAYMYDPKQM